MTRKPKPIKFLEASARVGKILLIVFILLCFCARYYQLAVYRGCGFNPIKVMLVAPHNELWCDCGYGGFSCMTCEELCRGET